MLFESIESSNSSIPPYLSQRPNYTTNFTFCQPLILHLFKFLFAHLYFNQPTAIGNGLEVEIFISEIDPGIQSNPTCCPYKFNTASTALASRPTSLRPLLSRIELLRGIASHLSMCRLAFTLCIAYYYRQL